MSIWTLWHPSYWEEGIVKAITACISLSTAIALFIHLPQALALPSPSQMRQKEQQLEAALQKERELNEFQRRIVSIVSHEYRTPLTAILSSIELLERNVKPTNERSARHFDVIKRKVAYLTKLIEDALVLDQSESGRLEFQPEQVDAIAVCQEILVEIDWDDHVLEVHSTGTAIGLFDTRLLNSLLTNLVYNACKYSPEGTTIYVRLNGVEGAFILEVEDQGIGIPSADIPQIFESYFRGANVEDAPGTGVGLAIVQKCVSLHGGVISVVSEVGTGTTFRVALPLRHGTP